MAPSAVWWGGHRHTATHSSADTHSNQCPRVWEESGRGMQVCDSGLCKDSNSCLDSDLAMKLEVKPML